MSKKKTGLILSLLGILSLVLITVGVTYAFFNYAKDGATDNSITSGSITFIYEEVEKNGAGISIENAFPVSDGVGKEQSGAKNVFNFTVKSQTMATTEISYTVTARKNANSSLAESAVKLYLTDVNGTSETPLTENIYQDLTSYANAPTGITEKIIYTGTVPKGTKEYVKNFRLRMWIPSTINFSPVQENGVDVYPYNGKTFTVTVNVYANAEVVNLPESVVTMTSETVLSIGDAVTAIDGSKWHVLEASAAGSDTVILLSDYNLNTDGTYNTECSVDINSTSKCSTMAFDSDNTQVYDETDSNNIGYFIANTYTPKVTSALPGTTNITLPKVDQIAIADNQTFNQSTLTLTGSWLLTTSYWTKTASESGNNLVWYVDSDYSDIDDDDAYIQFYSGARPVITTPKTNLLAE